MPVNASLSILRENFWQLAMYALGAALVALADWRLALVYLALGLSSNVLYMAWVCPYCAHYSLRTCRAGFHVLSGGRFRPHPGRTFARQFRRNVAVMFPGWFVPPVVGLALLIWRFSWVSLALLGLFCLVGFVILPKDSQRHCQDCETADCPRRPRLSHSA